MPINTEELKKDRNKTLKQIINLLIKAGFKNGVSGAKVARKIDRPNLYVLGFLDGLVASGILQVRREGRSHLFQLKNKKIQQELEKAET